MDVLVNVVHLMAGVFQVEDTGDESLTISQTRKFFVLSSERIDLVLKILDDYSGTSQFGSETLVFC